MSDWHFGMDYDMWLYPPVDWTAPDYGYELPEPIEAANIEGTLLVNAEDAIEQVHCLQAENAKLRELVRDMWRFTGAACKKYPRLFDPAAQGGQTVQLNAIDAFEQRMRELGIEVDG